MACEAHAGCAAQLNIERNRLVSRDGFRALAAASPGIRSLNVAGVIKFTDEALTEVAAGCAQLRMLQLSARSRAGAENIGDGSKISDAGARATPCET